MQTIATIMALLLAMTLLIATSRRIGIPYPMFLVLGGLGISFVPALPSVQLDPDLVFLVFLPPILTSAAFFTPFRDFKANLRPILLLALGCVLFTILAVGFALHWVCPWLPLSVCFTLGAIVAPPDAIAATAVAEKLGLPHRIVTILEGESLINDASALVGYRLAIAATASGGVTLKEVAGTFLLTSAGGIVVGLVLGAGITWLFGRLKDYPLAVFITLLNSFLAYLVAEALHVSGVLAAVVLGLFFGQYSSKVMSPQTRIAAAAFWQIVIYIINGVAFLLIGLQLPQVVSKLNRSWSELAMMSLVVCATVILSRLVWVFPASYLPRLFSKRLRAVDPIPHPKYPFIIGWAGMRGIVSLAAAQALALSFPHRDLLLFLTFVVILATLVGQGVTMLWLVPKLGFEHDNSLEREEAYARIISARAGLAHLDKLETEQAIEDHHATYHRTIYEKAKEHYRQRTAGEDHAESKAELRRCHELRESMILAEMEALIHLRNSGTINDTVLWKLQREFDLERLRFEDPDEQP